MKRNLLVTGGAGYLGSHLLHRLNDIFANEQDQELIFDHVDIVDDLSNGFRESILDLNPERFSFFDLSLEIPNQVKEFMEGKRYHAVLHLAGKLNVAESVLNPSLYYQHNYGSMLNLLRYVRNLNLTPLIFSSSAAVYGNTNAFSPIKETQVTAPQSPYGISKLQCERLLKDFNSCNSSFRHVSLRYFNIAGASDSLKTGQRTKNPYHLIHVAAKVATGQLPLLKIFGTNRPTKDGTCVRDYIHVEDLVDVHLRALKYLNSGEASATLNCGYEHETSVLDVINTMSELIHKKFPIEISENRPGDPDYAVASAAQLKEKFGWIPKRNELKKICQSALDWERKLSLS